jgi:hypothetical protein
MTSVFAIENPTFEYVFAFVKVHFIPLLLPFSQAEEAAIGDRTRSTHLLAA